MSCRFTAEVPHFVNPGAETLNKINVNGFYDFLFRIKKAIEIKDKEMISMQQLRYLMIIVAFLIGGCSGNSLTDNVTELSITTLSSEVVADGSSSTVVNATVKDEAGLIISGATVTFQTTLGTFASSSSKTATATSDGNGVASVVLSSTNAGTANVTALAGSVSNSVSVTFVPDANDQIAASNMEM